ncbi:hypothetical protein [Neisseria uirgultaei]|nr:hypothetical protein [Neisseria uirgultaei]
MCPAIKGQVPHPLSFSDGIKKHTISANMPNMPTQENLHPGRQKHLD